jgi:uncharacterized protein YggU (UPF0235/DUF167 family)
MKLQITVKTQLPKAGVEKLPDGTYRVAVNAPPREGQANEAVIEALAEFFGVRKADVRIVLGASGRRSWWKFRVLTPPQILDAQPFDRRVDVQHEPQP